MKKHILLLVVFVVGGVRCMESSESVAKELEEALGLMGSNRADEVKLDKYQLLAKMVLRNTKQKEDIKKQSEVEDQFIINLKNFEVTNKKDFKSILKPIFGTKSKPAQFDLENPSKDAAQAIDRLTGMLLGQLEESTVIAKNALQTQGEQLKAAKSSAAKNNRNSKWAIAVSIGLGLYGTGVTIALAVLASDS